jgi:hypothetical protein
LNKFLNFYIKASIDYLGVFMKSKALSLKILLVVFLALNSSACYKKPTTVARYDAPEGYISEARCLQLISGQAMGSTTKSVEIRKVKASCDESCQCKCTPTLTSAWNEPAFNMSSSKLITGVPSQKNTGTTSSIVKSHQQIVATPKTVKPKEVAAKETTKENNARASLNVKAVAPASAKAEVKEPGDQHIREVQMALNRKGAKLEVDGEMGERTVRLIKAFQTMNDLPVTGKADDATARALGIN